MQEAFRLGGWGMYPTLFVGCVLLVAAGRFAFGPSRGRLPVVFGLGVLTLLGSCTGFVTGVIRTLTGASELGGFTRDSVIVAGIGESLHNIGLGLVLLVLAGVAVVIGLARSNGSPTSTRADLVDPLRG